MVEFRKFDNFRRFFRNNSAKNCRSELSKDGKDASQRDLDLSRQKFYCKMNSSKVIFENPQKMLEITIVSNFEPKYVIPPISSRNTVCGSKVQNIV